MSSSTPKRSTHRTPWFQDGRTSGEKQTTYFVKIRKLQEQLINREQHNLINAMERLKQISYPRKKPFIRHVDAPIGGGMSFPTRPMNARRNQRPKLRNEQAQLKPLRGKHMVTDKEVGKAHQDGDLDSFTMEEIRRIYQMMPTILNDNDIAKIVCNVNSTFPNEPSTYLLQPHLPSIPNPKRKANTRLDNRLRLLTLATDPTYIETFPAKQIQTSPSQRRQTKTSEKKTSEHFDGSPPKHKGKRKTKTVLKFDVEPDDPTVFAHCVDNEEKVEDESDMITPLPPPNSRPNTASKQGVTEVTNKPDTGNSVDVDVVQEIDNPPESSAIEIDSEKTQQDELSIAETDNQSEGRVEVVQPTVTIVRKASGKIEEQE